MLHRSDIEDRKTAALFYEKNNNVSKNIVDKIMCDSDKTNKSESDVRLWHLRLGHLPF